MTENFRRYTISNSNHQKNSDYYIQTNFKPNNEIKIVFNILMIVFKKIRGVARGEAGIWQIS